MKETGRKKFYITFGEYGSGAYMGVKMYEGKTERECVLMRCKDALSYIDENGKLNRI